MLRLLKEHRDSNKEDLLDRILTGNALDQQNMQLLAQLKGQILTLDQLLNIKEFLVDLTEEHGGNDNELQSIGT